MENDSNVAQPSHFKPIINSREKAFLEMSQKIKDLKGKGLFNNPKNWPVYTKYLPSDDPKYTGLWITSVLFVFMKWYALIAGYVTTSLIDPPLLFLRVNIVTGQSEKSERDRYSMVGRHFDDFMPSESFTQNSA